ncbi:MAG: ABC transporter ATP-binding protein [Planctomycetes bacterium]|nr:ABC transporter ATP-binding protein [Planctomycetota bacterium]
MSRTFAKLEGVTKCYGDGARQACVLGPVDLEVASGEMTLVMGPSGSGKTTLLSILGLLLAPTEGRLSLAGEKVGDLPESRRAALRRRHVAFVFQHFNLLESLTACENVRVGLVHAGLSGRKADRRSREILGSLGLSGKEDSLPRELSGGEMQRVGIARAIAMPGRLVLADEPTAALDSVTGEAVMTTLADLARREERAIVAVTHDPRWPPLAHRVLAIRDGRITHEERRESSMPFSSAV